jgi:hypothetical protein
MRLQYSIGSSSAAWKMCRSVAWNSADPTPTTAGEGWHLSLTLLLCVKTHPNNQLILVTPVCST